MVNALLNRTTAHMYEVIARLRCARVSACAAAQSEL